MKNKWLSYTCMAALLSGVLVSCDESKFLDLKDPNHLTEDNFWRNETEAESALATAYSPIKYQMNGYYGAFDGWLNLNSRGDDIFTVLNEEPQMWSIAIFQNSTTTGYDPYGSLFTGIQRANVILKNIDNIPAGSISEEDRSMIKGEALFLRGLQYFYLVQNFKEVPLRLVPSNEDEPNKSAATEAQIWVQAEADLKDAINCNLPISRSNDQKGRVEKGAAIAILGKVYLYQHKYEEARQVLQTLMEEPYYPGRYALMENFADNFTPAKENNAESVFELQYSSDGELSWGNEGGISLGNSIPQFIGPLGWMKLMPSSFLVGEFAREERPSGSDTKYDLRMYASLFFNLAEVDPDIKNETIKNEKWYGGSADMDQIWEQTEGKRAGGAPEYGLADGKFLLKKYTAYWGSDSSSDSMGSKEGKANNLRVVRFAEVLLMYAEACAQTNDLAGAKTALKAIRARAGLNVADSYFSGFDKKQYMEEIEHQNLLELFGEGHRFDDLKRWYTTAEIKTIFKANDKQGADNFQEKYKYYPIPSGELNNNNAMEQTELWR